MGVSREKVSLKVFKARFKMDRVRASITETEEKRKRNRLIGVILLQQFSAMYYWDPWDFSPIRKAS